MKKKKSMDAHYNDSFPIQKDQPKESYYSTFMKKKLVSSQSQEGLHNS